MSSSTIVLDAVVTPEGTLELPEKLCLPPGRVRLTLEQLPSASTDKLGVLEVLEQIRKAQKERGFAGRTKEEIDADVNALREEWEERTSEIECLQSEPPGSSRRRG